MLQRHATFHAWIAFAWAAMTSALRYYWHWGGSTGVGMLASRTQDGLRDPELAEPGREDLGYQGMLLAVLALAILVSLRPWGEVVPQGVLFSLLYLVGAWLVLYGLAGWIADWLMVTGVRDIPDVLGKGPFWWQFLYWDPWWVLGGTLTFLTADACRRKLLPGTT